jgi:hypothetical protein
MADATLMTVYDANGRACGEVRFDGRMFFDNAGIFDARGVKCGEVSWAGEIFDVYGMNRGRTNRSGRFPGGRVESDGTVYDDQDVERGRIAPMAYDRMAGGAALLLLLKK